MKQMFKSTDGIFDSELKIYEEAIFTERKENVSYTFSCGYAVKKQS